MKGNKDLVGIKINWLLIVKRTNNIGTNGYPMWLCKCDCGAEKEISSYNLLYNPPKSCGCYEKQINKRKNRIGEKYEKLTIIGQDSVNRKLITVKCDCGTIKQMSLVNWRKSTRSCGCWKATGLWMKPSNIKPHGVAARNSLLCGYKQSAKDRSLSFTLTEPQFNKLTKSSCYYCGIEPYRVSKGDNGNYIYNGIDRVDNDRGYDIDNCVPCCKVCNRAKDIMTQQQFIEWVMRVSANFSIEKTNEYESDNFIEEIWTKAN